MSKRAISIGIGIITILLIICLILGWKILNQSASEIDFQEPVVKANSSFKTEKNVVEEELLTTKAAIVPHHLAAESIIGEVFSNINTAPKTILLISPDHWGVTQYKFTSTDQSSVFDREVNQALSNTLDSSLSEDDFGYDSQAINEDHGITNIIPIISKHFSDASIVPLLVSSTVNQTDLDKLVEQLEATLPSDTLVVASVDFSHYLPELAADLHDTTSVTVLSNNEFDNFNSLEVDCWECLYITAQYANIHLANFHLINQGNAMDYEDETVNPDQTTSYVGAIYDIGVNQTFRDNVTMIAVGDIMVGRYVETLMNQKGEDYSFLKTDQFFRGVDIVLGNLEGPIPEQHYQTPNEVLNFSFKKSTASLLKRHYFTDLSLANNHAYDKGEAGFYNTIDVLKQAQLNSIGNSKEISKDYIVEQTIRDQDFILIGLHANDSTFNESQAINLVEELNQYEDKFIIIVIHWGNEYVLHSNNKQQTLAHDLIDAGADLIIGHHPHVVQEVEKYNNVIIFYSLGNFIFDQYFSVDTEQGLAIGMDYSEDEISYYLYPLQSHLSQPTLMTYEKSLIWLEDLAQRSSVELSDDIKQGKILINR